MDFKYNDVLTHQYKNADIEIVVEDDVITTAKVYIDGKCVVCTDVLTDKGEDIPFNRTNLSAVYELMRTDVDKMWEENFKAVTAKENA